LDRREAWTKEGPVQKRCSDRREAWAGEGAQTRKKPELERGPDKKEA
jgi:hypothetical protein